MGAAHAPVTSLPRNRSGGERGLAAQSPETRESITHGPAPCMVLALQEGVGRQRTLQPLGMGWAGCTKQEIAGSGGRILLCHQGKGGLVAPVLGVRGCRSSLCWDEVWEVAGALQEQGKQEHEGDDTTGGSGVGGPG